MALRGARGASPGRLTRQLLSESVVLGVLAGIAGLIAAVGGLRLLVSLLPSSTPRLQDISVQWTVRCRRFIACGVAFGLLASIAVRFKRESGIMDGNA